MIESPSDHGRAFSFPCSSVQDVPSARSITGSLEHAPQPVGEDHHVEAQPGAGSDSQEHSVSAMIGKDKLSANPAANRNSGTPPV